MAIIQCPECNKDISDKAISCINCGYPLQGAEKKQGKAIFKASKDFIGIACSWAIMDEKMKILAKLKPNEVFQIKIDKKTTFYVKLKGFFGAPKQIICPANEISKFNLTKSQTGLSFVVSHVDVIDSD
jgi:hypothetical protein